MSKYYHHWANAAGEYEIHSEAPIVFERQDGGHWQSVAGKGVALEILRLRDALAAERERCVREIKDMMRTLDGIGRRSPDGTRFCCMQTLDELLRRMQHPTAPASGTDPEPAER